jgi:hypothetical protein
VDKKRLRKYAQLLMMRPFYVFCKEEGKIYLSLCNIICNYLQAKRLEMHTIYKLITYKKLAFFDYSYDTIYHATFSVVTVHSFLDARPKYKNKIH